MRVGVEVGGTFTDLVLIDGDLIRVEKVPSTPEAPDQGALNALAAADVPLEQVSDLVHGSTVATNAILERKGARVCLLITRGFGDVLQLQRHNRRRIYDLFYRKPEPVIARRDIVEIEERVAADGSVITPLDTRAAGPQVEARLRAADYQAVAICLLNSYANPEHERALAGLVAERFPDLTVTCSADVSREFREYERCSTTALAAYVQPVIDGYLRRFEAAIGVGRTFAGRFSIMQSNGGRLPAAAMARNAITSLFSGPAAGVIGAARQAERSGALDLITLDMGGTSTDVCLVERGKPLLAGETEIDGLPIKTPVIDIATVGAGGGSLVWLDDGGLLRVGPQSAGADPGPACYGRGGDQPTVTDAHVVRGTVRPESFLRGSMRIDPGAAERALRPVARALGLSVEQTADAAVRVAESNIVRAIQRISTEKGKDPRDYTLVPFGGAGPLQAVRVAEELGMVRVLVPPHAGVLSAFGLLAADYLHYETRTLRLPVEAASMPRVHAILDELAGSVRGYLGEHGLPGDEARLSYSLEMRYVTQAFEIGVDLPSETVGAIDASAVRSRFEAAHRRIFEHADAQTPCEIVSYRVGGAVSPGALPALHQSRDPAPARARIRIFDRGETRPCLDMRRAALDGVVDGPALVEDGTSTIFVPAGWSAASDRQDNLFIERRADAGRARPDHQQEEIP